MTRAYLEIKNLRKTWKSGGKTAVIDFSLSAEKGSMTAIVGPSGCGKSTVLRMVAGLVRPDFQGEGTRLFLDGTDLSALRPGKRGIGMVFQSPALFPHMRTDDNVAYGLRCQGAGKREGRLLAAEFLARFGLDGFSCRRPETLSGGEAQRVSLARTLIVRPKLVLFDEPLSALDAPLRRRLALDIRTMQKEDGFTGLFVTHDMVEAETVADRIVRMGLPRT